jgi:hypothetical protein
MAISTTAANSHLYCVGNGLPNTANPFSINVWINATWNAGTGRLSFVGLYNATPATGTPTEGAGLQIGTDGGGEVLTWTYGGTTQVTSAVGAMNAFNGQWVMITTTWDGTTNRIYRNGALLVSSTTVPAVTAQMTQVYINGYPPTGNANECAVFSVDSYGSYSRALSADEILTLYNGAGSRGGNVFQLACQYEFDEGIQGAAVGTNAGTSPFVVDMTGKGSNLLHTGGTNTVTYTYPGTYPNVNIRPVQ